MPVFHVKVSPNGRLVIPAPCRQALGITPGTELIITVSNDEMRIFTLAHRLKQIQQEVKKYTKGKKSLVDELISTRRKEAKNE